MMGLFAVPEALWLLLLLLPLALLIQLAWRVEQQDRRLLGDERLLTVLLHNPGAHRRLLRMGMLLAALLLLVVALARPQFGSADEQVRRKGLQVMIVLDGSLSMAAEDARPNRFEAAKRICLRLFDDLDGSQFGMVIFGQTSYVQFPLTSDLAAARSLVEPLTVDSINSPGSNIALALNEALRSFVPGQTSGRSILLITDGGDPEQDDPPGSTMEMVRKAAAAGVQIHVVGVGTPAGARIPYRDEQGMRRYVEDSSGREVVSRLNDQLLYQIASTTAGTYFSASQLDVDDLSDVLERGAPIDIADRLGQTRSEQFQLLAALALLLLVAEYAMLGRGGA